MQRDPFHRMGFFASLLAATVLTIAIISGCSDSDRVQIDFRNKIDRFLATGMDILKRQFSIRTLTLKPSKKMEIYQTNSFIAV